MTGRFKALLLLAWSLMRTVLRRLFTRRRDGLAAFRANYAADGLGSLTPDQRAVMTDFGRCIACGLCDRGEGDRIASSNGAYAGVMQLMLAGSRSMPDFAAAARAFSHVPESVLAEKEAICPTRVPMVQISRFVREKAGEARVSAAAGS